MDLRGIAEKMLMDEEKPEEVGIGPLDQQDPGPDGGGEQDEAAGGKEAEDAPSAPHPEEMEE